MKQLLKASLIVAGLVGVAWAGPVGPPGGPPVFNSGFPQNAQFNVSSGTVRDALYIRYLVPGLCHSTDAQGRLISISCGSGGGQTTLGVNWNGVSVTSPTIALNALSPIIVTAVSGGTTAQFSLDPSSVTLAGQAIIRLQDTRQVGAVLYIDSGTILNLITQNLVANNASFPNGLTANGTIVGNAQLQMFGLSTFFGPVLSANYGYTMPDGSVMTSTTNFVWNSAAPQNATVNITSATIRTQLSLPFLTPSQCMTTDAAGHVTSQVCGSGGTSIAVSTGGVIITSPTVQIDFNGSQFSGALTGPTSSQISLNLSSVTTQGNSIRLATLQTNLAAVGVATGTLSGSTTTLQNQVTANTVGLVAVGVTTGSLQTQVNGKGPGTITGVTAGANITGGGTASNVTVALSTGITVASATVTGDALVTGTATLSGVTVPRAAGDPYGAIWYFAEGNLPPGVVGAQTVSADSTTHTLWVNPNNAGWSRVVISSVTSATSAGLAIWNKTGNLGDMGPPPWAVVPSTFAWTLPYPVTASSQLIIIGGSTTIVGAATHTGFSTGTFANAFYDYTGSSVAIGFLKLSNGYGTAGQVITSGGSTSSATWTTASGSSGGSPLAVTIGVNRSSPTTDIIFNPKQATGSISGSTITVDISGLRTVGLDTATLKTGLVSVGVDTAAIRSSLNSEIAAVGTDTTTLKTGLVSVGVDTASIRSSLNSEIAAVGTDTTTLKSNVLSVGLDTATLKTGLVAVGVDTASLKTGLVAVGVDTASLKTGLVAVGVDTASLKTITVSIGLTTSTISNNYPVSLSSGTVGNPGTQTSTFTITGNFAMRGGIYFSSWTANGTAGAVNANYTTGNTDSVIFASSTAGGITITLGPASNVAGQVLQITKVDSTTNTVKIIPTSSDLISGTTRQLILNSMSQTGEIISDGIGWWPHGQGVQQTPPYINNFLQGSNVSVGTSSSIYTCAVNIAVPVTVTGFRYSAQALATPGQVSFGLYDFNGRLVLSTGPVYGSTAINTVSMGSSYVNVAPGQYYLAFQGSNTAITMGGAAGANSNPFCEVTASNSMGMPTSVTVVGGASTARNFAVFMLVNGGRTTE